MASLCVVILDHRGDVYLDDLVEGLARCCPNADIAWYNSGRQPAATPAPPTPPALPALPALSCSRPLPYGRVTPFFFDLFEWAAGQRYDRIVNAETDMAFVRPGFERFIESAMRDVDYLAPGFSRRRGGDRVWRPHRGLWRELPEMLAILGVGYTNLCFTPGQVFGARFAESVVTSPLYRDLRAFVERNHQRGTSFSVQETLLPTLADALAIAVRGYPSHLTAANRYRPYHTVSSIESAMAMPDAYFVHPVARDEADPARRLVRRFP